VLALASCALGHTATPPTERERHDAAVADGGGADAARRDAGGVDSGGADAGRVDGGGSDAGVVADAGPPVECTVDAECPAASCGPFGACSYASACATGGTQTRTCTDYACVGGACSGTTRTDTSTAGCDRGIECAAGSSASCTASCGSTGSRTCDSSCTWGACSPPGEACNLADDDCDGSCDEGAGCRAGVYRSYNPSTGDHFYTTSASEAGCCGYTVEFADYFRVYASALGGLTGLSRCWRASASDHFYTTSSSCEGASGTTNEGVLGYVATSATCGSTPLYRLYHPSIDDHFYTVSASERDSAIASGYANEGIEAYVWTTP
jgi:hypothetical protein